MKIAAFQFNPTVGDMDGNAAQIVNAAKKAYTSGVRVMLTPELALCGYIPLDLLLRPAFIEACDRAYKEVCLALAELKGFYLVLGHPQWMDGKLLNIASVLCAGKCVASYGQQLILPSQGIDKARYFHRGKEACVFDAGGINFGILIGEDIYGDAALRAVEKGAQVLLVLGASAFCIGGQTEREGYIQKLTQKLDAPIIFANLIGGQDELVLDGGSFAIDRAGKIAARAVSFTPQQLTIDICGLLELTGDIEEPVSENESIWRALVLGVKDYFAKNGFRDAVLGLSGGMDSALVLAIAVDALGAEHVRAVMMPSPYTADISLQDAREMAARMNVQYDQVAINPVFESFREALAPLFNGLPEDVTEENIQARVRGSLLMAISNKTGALVLVTGNKSELATGYCTLYGDMAGGFAVIKDVLKTRVYELARWRNDHDVFGTGQAPIPERIITRAPSAELRLEQTDQDSLPEYAVLDEIISRYVEQGEDIESIVCSGIEAAIVKKVARLIKISEYKRQQAPIGIHISRRAFGGDWRYPVTSKFSG